MAEAVLLLKISSDIPCNAKVSFGFKSGHIANEILFCV